MRGSLLCGALIPPDAAISTACIPSDHFEQCKYAKIMATDALTGLCPCSLRHQALIPPGTDAATLASLRINNLHVFCAHSEHSTVIMLSDC